MTTLLTRSDAALGDSMGRVTVSTPELSHDYLEGAVVDEAGDGLGLYTGGKEIWSTEQVVGNLLRANQAWRPGSTITYSFREAKPAGADASIRFEPLSGIERELTRLGFDLISDLVNLNFVEAPDDGRATGSSDRIYFGADAAAPDFEWGHASRWTVNGSGGRRQIVSGEVWISSDAAAQRVWFAGGYNFQALMHETLHTLGLPHPGDYNADGNPITYEANARYAQDSRQFTIMSYFSAASTGSDHLAEFVDPVKTFSSATPLLHDIAALQALYGANMTTRAGDTVYGYNSTAGRAPLDFALNPTPIIAIWDAGGTDRLDFSQTPYSVNLDLTPGSFSDAFQMTNNISIAFNVLIEDAIGGSGNDRLSGNDAANRLQGAAGDDELLGRAGDDVLEGGAGRDTLYGGTGNDSLQGGADEDRLLGEDGDDLMGGQDGNDTLDGGAGRDVMFGDAGNDLLVGGAGEDRLHGQDGDDRMGGQDGNDFLDGGQGRDALFGDAGDDTILGGIDDDRLHGQDGDDRIGGQDGNDYIEGGQGADALFGDAGDDWILGGLDNDRVHGQDGDDLIGGQDGDDYVEGGAGRDTLYGDAGSDFLFGGDGADNLFGGAGADRFVFNAPSQSGDAGRDRIFDFDAGAGDIIDLTGIDANMSAAGDQAFIFVGVFTGQAGQAVLNYDAGSNTTTLSLDVNGDGAADFRLDISGSVGSGSGFAL